MTFRIEKLHRRHAVELFDCGEHALNRFLVRYALPNQMANASQTYLGIADNDAIVGFYTLVVGEIRHEDAPERLTKGLARHPVPVMLLARLGVSQAWQGKRIGAGLLRDAVLRTLQVADIAGVCALVVHAKNEAARSFYGRFDFQPSPTDPLHLFAFIKDLKTL
ncbi:GNAT family N-acetyltransferase [Aureimonas altamirensis]|uniref:GNAT family N-acetyltransferase n=1 Tax=Aureimonas altamirensis TaxID=370622 RepID=UPI001E33A6A2|nr:GNAT family N-acetyltransferase [Aureimonas altamirensis]UHD43891.1 GNAT family N-acetyltransferase [Aureimonas altamirensis]